MSNEFLTPKEVASRLRFDVHVVYLGIAEGTIPAVRARKGGGWRIPSSWLEIAGRGNGDGRGPATKGLIITDKGPANVRKRKG